MTDRLFDRKNYSSKTLENFEIMSAYYIDIFYNHLYTEAKKLKINGSVSSITEGYKHTLNAFLKGLENPKLYKKSIVGIHHYFITIGFASISFAKCVDKLTKEFIPTDYFNSLTITQKMGVLRMVLNQSMKTFIRKIVDDHMVKIIDFHAEHDNVRILQDELIDCFILEREGMYQRFIAENTKTNKNETVNRLLAEKMQIEIKRLVKEKYDQQKHILVLKNLLLKKKSDETKVRCVIDGLQSEIELLKNQHHYNNTNKHQSVNTPVKLKNTEIINPDTQKDYDSLSIVSHDLYEPEQVRCAEDRHVEDRHVEDQIIDDEQSQNDEDDSSFIEVNDENIKSILQGDSDDLLNLSSAKMDEGTLLEDFS